MDKTSYARLVAERDALEEKLIKLGGKLEKILPKEKDVDTSLLGIQYSVMLAYFGILSMRLDRIDCGKDDE